MRRLPIYFLLDVSESMVGDNHRKLQEGIEALVRDLRRDPHALETAYLSAIAFAGKAKTLAPLVEVGVFYPPKLPLGSGTSLGRALLHLMAEIDRNAVKPSANSKGDWKPIVFLLSDGKPTDDYAPAIRKWKDEYARKASIVAIAVGKYADLRILKELTETVLLLKDTRDEDFRKFIAWVTASVGSHSRSVGTGANPDDLNLAAIDKSVLTPVESASSYVECDPDSVVLVGRCQTKRYPYLMKYERVPQAVGVGRHSVDTSYFDFSGCYPLDEDYFEWSDTRPSAVTINTLALRGAPGCPHCGSMIAFAMCGCGGILCLKGPGVAQCPWCDRSVNFAPDDGSGFDVNRARG